jgi:hypothetical protein
LRNFKELKMPFVNIKITREGATSEQKAKLIADSDETFHPFQRKVATCSKAKLPVIGAKRRWSFVLRQVVCQVKL